MPRPPVDDDHSCDLEKRFHGQFHHKFVESIWQQIDSPCTKRDEEFEQLGRDQHCPKCSHCDKAILPSVYDLTIYLQERINRRIRDLRIVVVYARVSWWTVLKLTPTSELYSTARRTARKNKINKRRRQTSQTFRNKHSVDQTEPSDGVRTRGRIVDWEEKAESRHDTLKCGDICSSNC